MQTTPPRSHGSELSTVRAAATHRTERRGALAVVCRSHPPQQAKQVTPETVARPCQPERVPRYSVHMGTAGQVQRLRHRHRNCAGHAPLHAPLCPRHRSEPKQGAPCAPCDCPCPVGNPTCLRKDRRHSAVSAIGKVPGRACPLMLSGRMRSGQALEPTKGPSMTLHMSATALSALGAAILAGLVIFRWSQRPARPGMSPQRGDLVQAVTVGGVVGSLIFVLLGTSAGGIETRSDKQQATPSTVCQPAEETRR